jgi:predicted dehydrogenase/threonine dehydrogenase-like Zn-dependent dehydrogenase
MKQILQSLRTGETTVVDVPVPIPQKGQLLISTTKSLVSAGTERMLVEFGNASWISKARQQPDKVRMVLDKARTDGIATTLQAVQSKLDQPFAVGYCNVGRVAEIGEEVTGFAMGDRVISNGNHAGYVAVGQNLCARVPDNVSDEEASFTVLGAIGLQGIRLAQPTLGECVVVTGLGLIGLLTVQLLLAQGCKVMGIDFDEDRLALARQFGAETANPVNGDDIIAKALAFSGGNGVDAVIVTASTDSDEPIHQAATICRKRGRIVLVGVVGLHLRRSDFYEKELTFQVSCSYGPGRYDPTYEEMGFDYPVGYVRWTEQRNFDAILGLMASGAIDVAPLITHRFPIDEAAKAMSLLTEDKSALGILLTYSAGTQIGCFEKEPARSVPLTDRKPTASKGTVAFIGAGNFAGRVLIPAFNRANAELHSVVSSGGSSAVHFGRKFGFANAATDVAPIYSDPAIDTVVIATRHDAHAAQVLASLRAGKHVYCEKPLCLNLAELDEIEVEARSRPDQHLMVGFNRRFSPLVQKMKALLDPIDVPKSFVMTVNAGEIHKEHWTQHTAVGGGRIIGEGCHFIDLLRHLAGARITEARAICLGEHPALSVRDDKSVITLRFQNGSTGVINYLANGHKAVVKERLEVFVAGRVLQLNNFRRLSVYGFDGIKGNRLWKQDKGQEACPQAFIQAIRNGSATPIALDEIIESSRVSIELGKSLIS